MKYVARTLPGQKIAIECTPLFGEPYTEYATFVNGEWVLPSGRTPTPRMLDAIDRLPDVSLRKKVTP